MIGIDTFGHQTDPRLEEEEKEFWCPVCDGYVTSVEIYDDDFYCNICNSKVEED